MTRGSGEPQEGLTTLRRALAEALLEHFAQEHLSVEEFERRIARARASTSAAELRALLADLPGGGPLRQPSQGRSSP